jgi:hypothetical protein
MKPQPQEQWDMATEKTYPVGMIGVGRKGQGHARGYERNPRTEIVVAVDWMSPTWRFSPSVFRTYLCNGSWKEYNI